MAGKKTGKRLLTWVLVLVMALSLLPLNALADEADEADALQMSDEDNSGDRSLMPAKTTYTLTFDANGGKLNNGDKTFKATYNSRKALVKSGDVANSNILDENPSHPPHVFQGWYYEDALGFKHNVDVEKDKVSDVLPLTGNSRTVYAKWKLPDGFKEASIFYLKDPTRDLDSNTGEHWSGPLGGQKAGFVNIANLSSWEETKTWGDWRYVENCFTVSTTDVTWPTGYGTPNKDGLELNKGSTEWNAIFEAFKTKVESDNGGISLTKDDVDSITLVPYKVSRYNSTGGSYHVDCKVEIQCKEIFTVKFFFNNGTTTDQLKAMYCRQGNSINDGDIPTTNSAPDGYEFDGWYTSDTFDPNTKVTFPLMPNANVDLYARYKAIETPNPEPDDPKLDVNFKYDKNIVDVICETTNKHNCSYGLKNGYYTVSDKKQLTNGNWQCKITIDLAKYFELYNSEHPGHTRDMNHPYATATMWISSTWSASSGQWSCAESLIDAAKIYVKCDATPTEYIPVTLTANSKTVTYNGKEQTVTGYTSNAPEGVTFEGITATGSGTNAGEYTVKFSNGAVGKTDTTGKYIVAKTVDGKLTIKPLDVTVTIKGNTGTYEYDGTEKTVEGYTVKIDNDLYTEADFKLVASQAKIRATVPGTYQMGLKPEDFENTNPNFNVTFVVKSGVKLTIENRPITITANDVTGKYDGQPHGENGYSITRGSLVDSHAATVTISGSETDAGKYEDWLVPSVTKIVDAENKDVTGYYDISYEDGFLTIKPRSVTLTSASASKPYDGTPLTKDTVTVGGDGFADGEGATYNVTGTITNVGETENTFTYTLNEGTKAKNYDITTKYGKLTITEASAPTPATFDFNDVDHDGDKETPAITKTVKGNVGKNFTEAFYVTVKGADEKSKDTMSAASYTGKAEVIASKSLKDVPFLFKPEAMANAVVPYGELRFTEAGTYTYTVREVPGGTSRMSYDTTEYTLTIEVVLDEDSNTYQVKSWQFTAGNREYPTLLNIVNTYRTYHPSTPSKPTLNTGDHYAYVMGYPDGTVRPNGSITRAEVSAILFRLLSDKTRDEYFTTESSFTDVKAGAWYNNSIATLEKAGVIVDTAKGGAFRPNEAITRAELAAMLAQFSDAKPVKGVKFSDVSAGHWAYEAIAIAAKMGWIEGYPDGTFRPDATITRAEMMTLVNRALERVPSDEDHLLSKRVMLTFPDCKSGDWFYIAVQEATNSHTYERAATEKNGDEQWTALRANRDWTLLEK